MESIEGEEMVKVEIPKVKFIDNHKVKPDCSIV
jgi:hypothetical protein